MGFLARVMGVAFATFFVALQAFAIETKHPWEFGIMDGPPYCQCDKFASCTRKPFHPAQLNDKQIIIVSDGRNTWAQWRWDVLSTVISSGRADKDLMCYSHNKGKQYGFTAHLTNFTSMVNGSDMVWISEKVREARNHFADYMVLDILDTVHEDNLNTTSLARFIQELKYSLQHISYGTQMLCLMPWTPDSFGADKAVRAPILGCLVKHCDGFMSDTRSYTSPTESCKARALVPLSKLVVGMDEFIALGIPVDTFFLGVPWHSFDYTCDSYDKEKNLCKLTKNDSAKCDYKSLRVKKSLGDLSHAYPDQVNRVKDHHWEKFSMAPYFTYEAKDKTHVVYFEDMHSLTMKYHLTRELEMKGVVIWSGDDLNYDTGKSTLSYDKYMWNTLHDVLIKNRPPTYITDQLKSFPSKMAGVGVGCMLLGTILGFVIGVIICVRRNRKQLHPPFTKDRPQEYLDEDPGM